MEELDPDVQPGDYCRKLGYEFVWTKEHAKGIELEKWRQVSDDLADRTLEAVIY